MKKAIVALVLSVMLYGVAWAQVASSGVFLPPAGEDILPATSATLVVDLGGGPQTIECSGPTRIQRGEPSGGMIQTEMLQLDLSCGGGIMLRLDPNRSSPGEIRENGDSFFDVFFEVTMPGVGTLANQNAARMQSKIGHVPPLGSSYFAANQVALTHSGQTVGQLLQVTHRVNGVPKPESSGEYSPVLSCFYECKLDKKGTNWLEITSLMLVNQNVRLPLVANMLFINGNQQAIGRAVTNLSPLDLDEVNVCATLDQPGLTVPPAGIVEVVLLAAGQNVPAGGVYGWVKNIIGKIPRTEPEPFNGKVAGVGKTACRLVGPNVARPEDVLNRGAGVATVNPVLIEGTAD